MTYRVEIREYGTRIEAWLCVGARRDRLVVLRASGATPAEARAALLFAVQVDHRDRVAAIAALDAEEMGR